ncbi:MAG: hypothetical protein ACKOVI_01540 [Candidatus Planktophila sp.]
MAESERWAITAIRDMHQEGFIAASLTRLGWKVIYRATSPEGLDEFLTNNQEALVVQSDDFAQAFLTRPTESVLIRGHSLPSEDSATADPRSDFELEELLRNRKSERAEEQFFISATTTPILSIFSVGRHVGASSISISTADFFTQQGEKVLLVDGNTAHPTLARHFSAHNIRTAPQITSAGFSLFEVSELSGLVNLNTIANQYDTIVIDAGQLQLSFPAGRRVRDQLVSWTSHSHARPLICTRTDIASLEELRQATPHGEQWTIALTLSKVISRRERKNLETKVADQFGVPVQSISRDSRAIEKMEAQNTTLAVASPKSILLGEIARSLEVAMR